MFVRIFFIKVTTDSRRLEVYSFSPRYEWGDSKEFEVEKSLCASGKENKKKPIVETGLVKASRANPQNDA
jgi:hypothetical protein